MYNLFSKIKKYFFSGEDLVERLIYWFEKKAYHISQKNYYELIKQNPNSDLSKCRTTISPIPFAEESKDKEKGLESKV